MTKFNHPAYNVWVCKKGCGDRYESPIPIGAYAHFCPKDKNKHVDSVPELLGDSHCTSSTKRVASPSNTKAPISREESMPTKRAEPANTATKKKAPAKATKAKATKAEDSEKKGRRSFGGRGWLAVEVDKYLRKTNEEKVSVGEIVKHVKNSAGEHPSTGAVAACLTRWHEQGYAKVNTNRPLSFTGFTAKWKDSTLQEFLDFQKEKRAKERAKTKAAKAA